MKKPATDWELVTTKLNKRIMRHKISGRIRVFTTIDPNEPSLTQQNMKDSTDVHQIMKKYTKNQQDAFLKSPVAQGIYSDTASMPSYQTAMEFVAKADSAFELLPSNIRSRFRNDPQQLMDFLQNPKNKEEAINLGILKKPVQTEPSAAAAPQKTDPPTTKS